MALPRPACEFFGTGTVIIIINHPCRGENTFSALDFHFSALDFDWSNLCGQDAMDSWIVVAQVEPSLNPENKPRRVLAMSKNGNN